MQVADPIIHHGDVRRMLLTAKAFAEGGRAMMYDSALLADGMLEGTKEEQDAVDDELGVYTPILKGFLTEVRVGTILGSNMFRLDLRRPRTACRCSEATVSSRIGAWSRFTVMLVSVPCMRAQQVGD